MKISKRLALTDDKARVVPYDSKEARYLFAAPGQEFRDALAEKYGLIDGYISEPKPEDEEKADAVDESKDEENDMKAEPKPEDKSKSKPETKPIIKPETKRR